MLVHFTVLSSDSITEYIFEHWQGNTSYDEELQLLVTGVVY